jgi:hypothetical protein
MSRRHRRNLIRTLLLCGVCALVASPVLAAMSKGPAMGPESRTTRPAFHGFYDGHKDTFLTTDVSDRVQAREMHINFAPVLKHVPDSAAPDLYLFEGRTATRQLPVFASEPGEKNYSPIWDEQIVRFKPGATPKLLTSDTQVEAAKKAGKITVSDVGIKLNCPIVKVGR